MNRWWAEAPRERYWLETTDRLDLGVDLNAPQRGEKGQEYWGYSLILEVQPGDVVLHYSKSDKALVAWSRAVGRCYEDEVFWGARGMSARGMGVEPYYRPGWRISLEGPFPLAEPITLAALREREEDIRAVRAAMPVGDTEAPYFPVELSPKRKRPLRPTQAYLTKPPASLVDMLRAAFPLAGLPLSAETPAAPTSARKPPLPYRRANENAATSRRKPFDVDPSEVDRALQGHAVTQNSLADAVTAAGFVARSPRADEPQFDLAWVGTDGRLRVAEVKSLTKTNEERQLRLALGQVLRYAHLLAAVNDDVIPVVVPERRPADSSWLRLCESLGVTVAWPGDWDRLL